MSDTPFRRTIRHAATPDRVRQDIDDEIAFHLDQVTKELMQLGHAPEEARRLAEQRFGNRDRHREQLEAEDRRAVARTRWRDRLLGLVSDLRYSARALAREPWFALGVVATLGVGLAANATMFSVVDRLLLRPPPHVRDDPRLNLVYFVKPGFNGGAPFVQASTSYPDFLVLRDSSGTMERAAAFWSTDASLDRGAEARKVHVGAVTRGYFELLGTRPILGRLLTPADAAPNAGETPVVLSFDLWSGKYAADPQMVGRVIRIDEGQFVVVGVTPRGFHGVTSRRVDAWLPLERTAASFLGTEWQSRSWFWLRIVGQRKGELTAAAAAARATIAHQQQNRAAKTGDSLATVTLGSIIGSRGAGVPNSSAALASVSTEGRTALWLSGVAGIVLLIVCANTANLFLARANRRRRELAVRLALGAARGRLARLLVSETLLLSVGGAGLALALTYWGSSLMRATLLSAVAWDLSPVTLRVVLFTLLTALVATCLAGIAPAVIASRQDVNRSLKSGTRDGGMRRTRLQQGLLVAQGALSVLLLVGAGLFVRSLRNATSLRVGFDPDQVLVARIDPGTRFQGDTARSRFYEAAVAAMATVPGVRSASIGVTTPVESSWGTDLFVPGYDSLPKVGDGWYINAVSNNWFETLGTRIVRGRPFQSTDTRGSERVAIVNEHMAHLLWPSESALGKCLKVGADTAPCSTVVGVMENVVRNGITEAPSAQYLVLLDQLVDGASWRSVFVRVQDDPRLVIPRLRQRLHQLVDDLPFAEIRTLRAVLDPEVQQWRLGAAMFGIFGLIALLVALIGLYALVGYDVVQRWHELGVRAALGARGGDMYRLVIRDGLGHVVAGLAVGLALAWVVSPLASELLFRVSPRDPWTYTGVALVLLAAAVVAVLAPARRASRVDPAQVLRAD